MAKLPRWSALLLSLTLLAGPSLTPASAGDRSSKTIGQDPPAYSEADRLIDRGLAEVNNSNLRQGLLDYQKALALYQRDRNEQGILTVQLNSAIIYSNWGQYQKALDRLTPIIARQTELLTDPKQRDPLHPHEILTLRTNLRLALRTVGQIYFALGNPSKAEDSFRSALAQGYGRSLGDTDCLWDTVIWNDLGRILAHQGKIKDAQAHYEHAFRLIEAIGYSPSAVQFIAPLQKPGAPLVRPSPQSPQERFEQMMANRALCFRNPRSINLPPFPPLNQQIGNDYKLSFLRQEMQVGFISSLQNLADIYLRQGNQRAFDYALSRGLVLSDRWRYKPGMIGLLTLRAEQQTEAQNLQAALTTYEQILPIAQSINDTATIGQTYHRIGKLKLRLNQPAAAATALTKAVESWEQLRTNLTDLDKVSLQETQAETYRLLQQALVATNQPNQALVAAERGRSRAFLDLLSRRLGDRTITTPKAPDLAQIQATARSKNATIVEYSVITDRLIYAWVIPPSGPIGFREIDLGQSIGPKQTLTSLLDEVRRNDLWVRGRGHSAEAAAKTIAAAQPAAKPAQGEASLNTLHSLLWQPIASLLPTDPNASVIIIPQGELFFVPFAALLDNQGRYLIEQHSLSAGPSIQSLDLTHQAATPQPIAGAAFPGQSLVVGNPTMPQVRLAAGQPLQTLSTLPGSQVEAETIARFINATPWTGAEATKARVVAQMPQSRLIHFATHGLLQDFKGLGMPGAIALAPGPNDNGLLTADEILDLKLSADLVVLSACYTGRGRVTDDGVLGLSRSLLAAGAPSVIVSLWAVPDDPTADLMTAFYKNLQRDPNKAQALRRAMISMIDRYPSPRDWAAFTLIGEAK